MQLKKSVVIGLAAVGLTAAGGGAAFATSQRSNDANQPPPAAQAFLQDVAKRLGVTEDQLTDALKGAAVDQVDAAVAAGRITQAQADAIKARIQSGAGVPFFGGRPGHLGGPGAGVRRLSFGPVLAA